MANKKQDNSPGGIVLLGLGPGDPGVLTREAWDWLMGLKTLVLRTKFHPTVTALPEHLVLESFDDIYDRADAFEAVYAEIVDAVLTMGLAPDGVTYAVPGHPFVAEATCPEIAKRAQADGIPVRVIDGLSFLEPTFRALGLDPFPELILADAISIGMNQTPGFSPSSSALIAQIYSSAVAADVKLTLMSAYSDEHRVKLVHGAGTAEEKVEEMPLYAIDHSPHLGLLSSLFVPPLSACASFESFQEVIARLRAPDGCPWDQAQTHLSLRPFLLEEAYETLDALDREDQVDLQEELGDLLLQIVLHAQIASEEGDFNIHHVLEGIGSKLVRRHPHVFSEVDVDGVEGVISNWEAIKAEERAEPEQSTKKGLLDGVPLALPALTQAEEMIERVGRVNFDLLKDRGNAAHIQQIVRQIEENNEFEQWAAIGELLMAVASLAHEMKVDAESTLREALTRFRRQFGIMESLAAASGRPLVELDSTEQTRLWSEAGANMRKGEA